jgi:hypothetical protein
MKTSYLVKQLFGTILFFGLIFISAGRLDYWQGLVFTGTSLIMQELTGYREYAGKTTYRIFPYIW